MLRPVSYDGLLHHLLLLLLRPLLLQLCMRVGECHAPARGLKRVRACVRACV